VAGVDVAEHWEYMRRRYYELMGWDHESGRPLPETLEQLGLAEVIPQVWG
jgi:aldehyde:ferredoxin oxidoreductase